MSPLTVPNYINEVRIALLSEILALTPVGYWPLGEASGNALDLSGNGNDGVVTLGAGVRNAPALDVVDGDGSIEFDSVNTKVQIPDDLAIQNIFDAGGTIFFMFDADSDGENSSGFIATKGFKWDLEVGGETGDLIALLFFVDFDGANGLWITDVDIPKNTTIIGALKYNVDDVGNVPILYLWDGSAKSVRTVGDGLTQSSTPTGTRVTDVGDDFIIGNREDQFLTFDGHIDEVPLYNRELTEEQIFHLIDVARGVISVVPTMPDSIRRILNYFPEFTHESKLIQSMAIGDYEEIRSRLFDLIDQLSENSTGVQANDTGVILWEEALGLIANISDSIELKRSNILAKTIRKNRIRNVDIGNVVRLFTTGPRTFTRQQVVNEIDIPVSSLEGFGIGQQIYVGPTLVTVNAVDQGNRLLIVNTPVSAHAYAAVTTQLIVIEETPPSYIFDVLFNPGDIEDVTAMQAAVEEAKPAHLGFNTRTLWSPFIWDSDILEGWNKSEIADIAGYWDFDQLTGDMIDISGKGNDGVVTLGDGTRGVDVLSPLSQTNGEGCMTFDGLVSKIQVADALSLQNIFDGEGFVAFKFNVKSDGEGSIGVLVQKEGRWQVRVEAEAGGNVAVRFFVDFDGTNGVWITAVNVSINADHELIIRYDADAVANDPVFILDGTELIVGGGLTRTSTPVGTRVSDVGSVLVWGNNSGQTATTDGEIDEGMLSGDSITTVEAQAWFATHLVDEMNTNRLGPRFF